jgi:alkyl hydroperoxide reductase subunit AhpF
MEKLLNDAISKQVQDVLASMDQPVEVLLFTDPAHSSNAYLQQLLEEVAALSPKIGLSIHTAATSRELAGRYHVDKFPGFVIARRQGDALVDVGVRFAGLPASHEFNSLIRALVRVSLADSGLQQVTRAGLAGLKAPVHLMVFVTPT